MFKKIKFTVGTFGVLLFISGAIKLYIERSVLIANKISKIELRLIFFNLLLIFIGLVIVATVMLLYAKDMGKEKRRAKNIINILAIFFIFVAMLLLILIFSFGYVI